MSRREYVRAAALCARWKDRLPPDQFELLVGDFIEFFQQPGDAFDVLRFRAACGA